MIESLYYYTRDAFYKCPENLLERKDWLFKYPAQPVLVVDMIKWTNGCVSAIQAAQEGNREAIIVYYEKMK